MIFPPGPPNPFPDPRNITNNGNTPGQVFSLFSHNSPGEACWLKGLTSAHGRRYFQKLLLTVSAPFGTGAEPSCSFGTRRRRFLKVQSTMLSRQPQLLTAISGNVVASSEQSSKPGLGNKDSALEMQPSGEEVTGILVKTPEPA